MAKYTEKDIARFWEKVSVSSSIDECWNWTRYLDPHGYGGFRHGGRSGRCRIAHRVAFELTYGEIPDGLVICHKCDNPTCCNPNHLFQGTHADNVRDKVAKGRQHRGENHPGSKLTAKQVQSLRQRYAAGKDTVASLASELGVHEETIRKIVNRQRWAHVS